MLRHLISLHPKAYMQFQKTNKITKAKPPKSYTGRGWIKKYLKRLDNKRGECTICHTVFRMPPGRNSNLRRHISLKHPSYYQREVIAYKKSLNRTFRPIKTKAANNIILNDVNKQIDVVNTVETRDGNAIHSNISEDVNSTKNIGKNSKKINWHKAIKVQKFDILHERDPELEEKIKQLCNKNNSKSKRRQKTCFWNFFVPVNGDNLYKCMFCLKDVLIISKNVSNLKTHMAHIHPEQCMLILKHAPPNDSCNYKQRQELSNESITTEFVALEKGSYKCKKCSVLIECGDDIPLLASHIREAHREKTCDQPNPVIVLTRRSVRGSEKK